MNNLKSVRGNCRGEDRGKSFEVVLTNENSDKKYEKREGAAN